MMGNSMAEDINFSAAAGGAPMPSMNGDLTHKLHEIEAIKEEKDKMEGALEEKDAMLEAILE